jgi:hypothetical protein
MVFKSSSGATDRYKNGWVCDSCSKQWVNTAARWNCDICTYDICDSCAPKIRRETFADAFNEVKIV